MGRKKSEKFIIKAQISLYPIGGGTCLIYNKDKSIHDQMPTPKYLVTILRGQPKGYFWATRSKNGIVTIIDTAPEQDW